MHDGVLGTAKFGAADGGVMRKGNSMRESHLGAFHTSGIPDPDDLSVCVEEEI